MSGAKSEERDAATYTAPTTPKRVSPVMAMLQIGGIAYFRAVRPAASGVEVSRGITSTVIRATLFVLLVHFSFAFVEFDNRGL